MLLELQLTKSRIVVIDMTTRELSQSTSPHIMRTSSPCASATLVESRQRYDWLSSKVCAGAMDRIRPRLLLRDSVYCYHARSACDLSATAVTVALP